MTTSSGSGGAEGTQSTAARIQAVSGFKWQEKSPCHGSMMNHYGRVTRAGGGGDARLIERRALKVQGQGSRRGEGPATLPSASFAPYIIIPARHSIIPLAEAPPLIFTSLPCADLTFFFYFFSSQVETSFPSACFPLPIITASSSKVEEVDRREAGARHEGTRHLITGGREECTRQGRGLFDHSLASLECKEASRKVHFERAEQAVRL